MCIIIDTNCFCKIFFDSIQKVSPDFKPLYKWIFDEGNKIVYGGSKYEKELLQCVKILPIINQLRSAGKVIVIKKVLVDKEEAKIKAKKIYGGHDFDDEHIVAIIIISRCRLVCTEDIRAMPYIKGDSGKFNYPSGVSRPKIYHQKVNKKILVKANIGKIPKSVIE